MLLNISPTTTTYFKFDWATSILVTDVGDESVGDNLEMLMTVLAVFVNILYLLTLASGTNIQKMLPDWRHKSKFCH